MAKDDSDGALAEIGIGTGDLPVTNRWLTTTLHLGNLFEVSRKVAAWMRNPEPSLCKKLR